MGVLSGLKLLLVVGLLAGAGGGFFYVKQLQSNLEIITQFVRLGGTGTYSATSLHVQLPYRYDICCSLLSLSLSAPCVRPVTA